MVLVWVSIYLGIGFVVSQMITKESKEKLIANGVEDTGADKQFSKEHLIVLVEIAIMLAWPIFLIGVGED